MTDMYTSINLAASVFNRCLEEMKLLFELYNAVVEKDFDNEIIERLYLIDSNVQCCNIFKEKVEMDLCVDSIRDKFIKTIKYVYSNNYNALIKAAQDLKDVTQMAYDMVPYEADIKSYHKYYCGTLFDIYGDIKAFLLSNKIESDVTRDETFLNQYEFNNAIEYAYEQLIAWIKPYVNEIKRIRSKKSI